MLALYNKDFTTKYGAINSIIEAFVEEERNGLFELSFVMLNTDSLFKYVEEDNIVVANANNTLVNQKFRIYMTRKLMNNRVEVFARHISFDLMYDYIDNISFENQPCEYALNSLFRNSNFSKHYKGYSDIINAQNYSMSMANVLEAIGGKEGSIIDTFGTGAELLRDNENIHILNKRGHDNSVSIEYKKNLTGFELEEDTTELITRILPYARYTPKDSEGNLLEETTIKASFVDSPLLANYSHPFIKFIDYTDKFKEGEEVTTSKLITFAQNEYKVNKVDIPKQNFKIEFIPLSKCVGYEGLEDDISLCDTVTIKDTRYNIDTQAKVIKVIFNVLKNRYESMELGEPKTSLGDIIGNNNSTKGEKGDKGDKGDKGEDGSIGDFPNTLPATPIVNAKVYGFANIEISWTFENKVYYQYEVYASKEADFTPNTFNLIHSGQTSTYMYQAKPNETWYFKVCAINTHGDRTNFGNAYATTAKVDDLSNYVGEMAIDEALIGTLSLDRGWVGTLKGNHIDAKNLSVTNGNGKRTLDIDSYGNVSLDVASLKISSSNVATENYANTKATQALNDAKAYTTTEVSKTSSKVATIETNLNGITQRVSATETNLTTTTNKIDSLEIGGRNYIRYGKGNEKKGFFTNFSKVENGYGEHTLTSQKTYASIDIGSGFVLGARDYEVGKQVTFSYEIMYTNWNFPSGTNRSEFWMGQRYTNSTSSTDGTWRAVTSHNLPEVGKNGCELNKWFKVEKVLTIPEQAHSSIGSEALIRFYNSNANVSASVTFRIRNVKIEYGNKATDWTPAPEDVQSQIDTISSGLNKWLFEVFDRGSVTGTGAITLNDLVGKTPRQTLLISEPSSTSDLLGEDYFLGRLTTNVYLDADYTWDAKARSDDGSSIYLNGNLIVSMDTCVSTSITMPFKKGWNKITWVVNENIGSYNAYFAPALSSLSQIKIIDAFSHTNIDEDKTILNSNIAITNNRVAEITTNLDSITQRVSATETTTSSLTTQMSNKEDVNSRVIYAKGNGNDAPSNSIVKVGSSTLANGHGRGLNIVALNPTTLAQYYKGTFDTFGGDNYRTQFAEKIQELNNGNYIIVVTSSDSACLNYATVCNALYLIGGSAPSTSISSYREAYALIGKSKLGKGNGLEMYIPKTAYDARVAEVSVKVSEQGALLGVNSNNSESKIDTLTTRVSTAESKLTKDSLTTTIGSHYTTSSDVNGIITSKGYATTSEVKQTTNALSAKFSSSGGYNLLRNTSFANGTTYWSSNATCTVDSSKKYRNNNSLKMVSSGATSAVWKGTAQRFVDNAPIGKTYRATLYYYIEDKSTFNSNFTLELKGRKTGATSESTFVSTAISASNLVQGAWTKVTVTATTSVAWDYIHIYPWIHMSGTIWISDVIVTEGELEVPWSPHPNEVYDGITKIDKDGIKVSQSNINTTTTMNANGFYINKVGKGDVFRVNSDGVYLRADSGARALECIASNGNRDMLLYGGQMCIYNNMNNTFMGTIGSVLNSANTFKGTGFLLGKDCTNFVIGRDSNWSDILTNRSPNPTHYLNIDFSNKEIVLGSTLKCSNVNMQGGNLTNATTGKIMDIYSYGFYAYNTGKQMFSTNGYDMHNGANWDWKGHNILSPIIIGGSYGYSVVNDTEKEKIAVNSTMDTISEIKIVQSLTENNSKILDVSNVTNKDEIMLNEHNVDLSKLVTLLISEVKKLKNEIEDLKSRNLKD